MRKALVALAIVIFLAGCGGKDDEQAASPFSSGPMPTPTPSVSASGNQPPTAESVPSETHPSLEYGQFFEYSGILIKPTRPRNLSLIEGTYYVDFTVMVYAKTAPWFAEGYADASERWKLVSKTGDVIGTNFGPNDEYVAFERTLELGERQTYDMFVVVPNKTLWKSASLKFLDATGNTLAEWR